MRNMSERESLFTPRSLSLASGFRADPRFWSRDPIMVGHEPLPEPEDPPCEEPEPVDPVALAYADGYAAGRDEAETAAAEQARLDDAAREGLALSFARLDARLEEELRLRLRDMVAALCESAIAPLALDETLLARRIENAVSMLARADDERVIRLHPDDIPLVAPKLRAEWQVAADPALERGALRIESQNGGVEDGPATWRRAIAEALRQC